MRVACGLHASCMRVACELHASCMRVACELHASCMPIHPSKEPAPQPVLARNRQGLWLSTLSTRRPEVTCLVSTGFRGGRCLSQGHLELRNGAVDLPRTRRACENQTVCMRCACGVRNTNAHPLGLAINVGDEPRYAYNQAALDVLKMPYSVPKWLLMATLTGSRAFQHLVRNFFACQSTLSSN
jgi:hypothetical protein